MAHRITPFHEWIRDQNAGISDDQITSALATVTERVQHLNKKGKVLIEVALDPAGSGGRHVTAYVKVTAKAPEPEPTPSVYFVGDNGSLHRNDPYQSALFDDARRVDVETDVRKIPTTTSEED